MRTQLEAIWGHRLWALVGTQVYDWPSIIEGESRLQEDVLNEDALDQDADDYNDDDYDDDGDDDDGDDDWTEEDWAAEENIENSDTICTRARYVTTSNRCYE